MSAVNLHKLQRIQNNLACDITYTNRKCDRITPVLQALHWLILELRIRSLFLRTELNRHDNWSIYQSIFNRYYAFETSGHQEQTYYIFLTVIWLLSTYHSSRSASSRPVRTQSGTVLPIQPRSLATASTTATFFRHLKSYLFSLAYAV